MPKPPRLPSGRWPIGAFPGTGWCPGKSTYYKAGKQYDKIEPKEREGLITARDFGGTAKWRTCYTSDGTGHTLLFTMDNVVVQLGVTVHDRVEAISLIHDGVTCMGAVARCLKTGKLRAYLAKATLIATGGYGRLYRETTNAVINDGSGAIIALDTGIVPLGNMEAVQFHPTGIVPTNILVTEGCRGDGGTLKDVNEERFMHIYEPGKQELASRDVVSRWMTHHIREGKGRQKPLRRPPLAGYPPPGRQAYQDQAPGSRRDLQQFFGNRSHHPDDSGPAGPALQHGRGADQ